MTNAFTRRKRNERRSQARPHHENAGLSHTRGVGDRGRVGRDEGIVEREVNEAADQALQMPVADKDSLDVHLYSPDVDPTSSAFDTEPALSGKEGTTVDLLNVCLKDEMEHDPRMVVFGQDVADATRKEALDVVKGKGGVFKVTFGLQRHFGSHRVYNSPLSEASIVGMAIGMANRRLETGGGDSVLRLHLAGLHADKNASSRQLVGARMAPSLVRS